MDLSVLKMRTRMGIAMIVSRIRIHRSSRSVLLHSFAITFSSTGTYCTIDDRIAIKYEARVFVKKSLQYFFFQIDICK